MLYDLLAEAFEQIEQTTKRLEMTDLLVDLLRKTPKEEIDKVCFLCLGELHPPYLGIELGIAEKLAIRAISIASGWNEEDGVRDFKEVGDLGRTIEKILAEKSQRTLTNERLTVASVWHA